MRKTLLLIIACAVPCNVLCLVGRPSKGMLLRALQRDIARRIQLDQNNTNDAKKTNDQTKKTQESNDVVQSQAQAGQKGQSTAAITDKQHDTSQKPFSLANAQLFFQQWSAYPQASRDQRCLAQLGLAWIAQAPHNIARLQAIISTLQNQATVRKQRSFSLDVCMVYKNIGIDEPAQFITVGNALRQQLLEEAITCKEAIAKLALISQEQDEYMLIELLLYAASSAMHFNENASMERSFCIIDFCNAVIRDLGGTTAIQTNQQHRTSLTNNMPARCAINASDVLRKAIMLTCAESEVQPNACEKMRASWQTEPEHGINFIIKSVIANDQCTCSRTRELTKFADRLCNALIDHLKKLEQEALCNNNQQEAQSPQRVVNHHAGNTVALSILLQALKVQR